MSSRSLLDPHPRHRPTQAEILSSEYEIQRLDGEIGHLTTQIEQLQAQLARLQHERDNHASFISPLRCLPAEILTEIVHLCLVNGVSHEILMKICGTIRDIVIGTPVFWKTLRIVPLKKYNPSKGYHCSTIEQLQLALMCAKSTALNLQIDTTDHKSRSYLMSTLKLCKSPIHSLDLYLSDKEEIQSTIACLNLGNMKNFALRGVHHDVMEAFLDLLMQYDQNKISITVECYGYEEDVSHVLEHTLLQRATALELNIGWYHLLSFSL
ncbi:hypothetical protein CPB86DRAFT_561914 [Serendipita vermifera]|nr:hypothetical protein CPB86DRAFT_561914 [Serendipita vermifera]